MLKKIMVFALTLFISITSILTFDKTGVFAASSVSVTCKDGTRITYSVGSNKATKALREAFEYTNEYASKKNPCTITVTPGKYEINRNIVLSSYTTLNLEDVTLINANNGAGNIFTSPIVDLTNQSYYGYDALRDFTMNGGILDYASNNKYGSCLMRLAHSQNITIRSVTFLNNYNSHHIEVAACKNMVFNGCIFEGQVSDYSKNSSEALQIDILEEQIHFTKFPYYDGTMNDNIEVKNCTFRNLVAGIGTRSAFAGKYQTNIKITNNVFENIKASAIICTNYSSLTISSNKIDRCGEGIVYYMNKSEKGYCYDYDDNGKLIATRNKNSKTVITNNSISVVKTNLVKKPRAVYLHGGINKSNSYPLGNYAVYKLQLIDNTINTEAHGIVANDIQSCTISNNLINYKGGLANSYHGVLLGDASAKNTVCGNMVSGFEFGISLKGNSINNTIDNNEIKSSLSYGVLITENSNNNTVSNNLITSCGKASVYASSASGIKVKSNMITSSKGHGVQISNAGADVTANTITDSKKSGIFYESSKGSHINLNTVTYSGENGICISKSNLTNIQSNVVIESKWNGINISDNSMGRNVLSNSVRSSGKYGISVYQSYVNMLSSNNINSVSNDMIFFDNTSTAGDMGKNTFAAPQ